MKKLLDVIKSALNLTPEVKEVEQTLEDKLRYALGLGSLTRSLFIHTLEDLKEVNVLLGNIKVESENVIKQHQDIINVTSLNSYNNKVTISNIQKLINVEDQVTK